MRPMVRGEPEALPQWDGAQPVAVDAYKLTVWICAIVTPRLLIATVVALIFAM